MIGDRGTGFVAVTDEVVSMDCGCSADADDDATPSPVFPVSPVGGDDDSAPSSVVPVVPVGGDNDITPSPVVPGEHYTDAASNAPTVSGDLTGAAVGRSLSAWSATIGATGLMAVAIAFVMGW